MISLWSIQLVIPACSDSMVEWDVLTLLATLSDVMIVQEIEGHEPLLS